MENKIAGCLNIRKSGFSIRIKNMAGIKIKPAKTIDTFE
jgi:hypothetical protein